MAPDAHRLVEALDPVAYQNLDDTGQHTPGPDPDCVRLLVNGRDVLGFGTETIGTDAGQAAHFAPPYPCHYYMHGAGKYGLQCLCNLDLLPATGALIVAAPLKIHDGSGSPFRVFAMVPPAAFRTAIHVRAALGAILFVLRLDSLAGGLPLRIRPMPQLVKIAAGRVALRAVERNGFAGQPLAAVGDQKRREVLQFLDAADPAHRVARSVRAPGSPPGLSRLPAPSVGISPGAMALSRMP